MNSVLRVHIKTFYLNIITNHNNTSSFTLSFTLIHSLYSFTLFTLTFLMLNIHSLESIYTFCNDRLSAINTCVHLGTAQSPSAERIYGVKTFDHIVLKDNGDGTQAPLMYQNENGTDLATIRYLNVSNGYMELRTYGSSNPWRLENATPPADSNSNHIPTTAWVNNAIGNYLGTVDYSNAKLVILANKDSSNQVDLRVVLDKTNSTGSLVLGKSFNGGFDEETVATQPWVNNAIGAYTKQAVTFRTIPGITITNLYDRSYWFKTGNIVVVNIVANISGTYTGSDYWQELYGSPGYANIDVPYFINVVCGDNVTRTVHQGRFLHLTDTAVNFDLYFQVVYTIGA